MELRHLSDFYLDCVRAWRTAADLWDRLRFANQHGMHERIVELLAESLLTARPLDDLVEPRPLADPDYQTTRESYIAALVSGLMSGASDPEQLQACSAYTALIEARLIGPMRTRALTQADARLQAAGVLLADLYRDAYLLAARVEAAGRAAAQSPGDVRAQSARERLVREYSTILATIHRQTRDYERARRRW
jgi:hypothetical protein